MTMPTLITHERLIQLSQQAAEQVRRRQNLNLHPQLDDPVQRMFNALEPGTYVRPHRHARNEGWELMLCPHGAMTVLLFDADGQILQRMGLGPDAPAVAVEIPAHTWHTVRADRPGTVMFEVKPGPYSPLADKDFAPWAPSEGNPACARLLDWFASAQPGDRPPPLEV